MLLPLMLQLLLATGIMGIIKPLTTTVTTLIKKMPTIIMVAIVSPTTVTNYNKNEMHNPIIITAQLIPDASHYSTHGSNK